MLWGMSGGVHLRARAPARRWATARGRVRLSKEVAVGSTPVQRRSVDIGAAIAIAWLLVAVALTIGMGPWLGARGWLWLGLHHVLCVFGAGHELLRAYRGRRAPLAR